MCRSRSACPGADRCQAWRRVAASSRLKAPVCKRSHERHLSRSNGLKPELAIIHPISHSWASGLTRHPNSSISLNTFAWTRGPYRPRPVKLTPKPRRPIEAVGVGKQVHPSPAVGRSDFGAAEHAPLRIEPQAGQISEDDIEASRDKEVRVFHEHDTRSYFANQARHVSPQAGPGASEAGARSGRADILAREAPRDDIHVATKRSSVKGSDVIPDREQGPHTVLLAPEKHLSAVGIDLDGADDPVSEEQGAEESAAGAGKEGELSRSSGR